MRRTLIVLACLFLVAACGHAPPPYTGGKVDALKMIDLKVGDGVVAKPGMDVMVDYTGWIYDQNAPQKKGRRFDSSSDHGSPFSFTLGQGRVIKGWDEGVAGMRVGGERRLIIPAGLAYGDRGAGAVIPPGAALVFDITLRDADAP
jgi:FKBP-type peptidyl-prolyl cis-trans isomerase FkpA